METKVKIVITYVMTLSELEFYALRKLIGATSYDKRKEYGLSNDENNVISELYGDINIIIGEQQRKGAK